MKTESTRKMKVYYGHTKNTYKRIPVIRLGGAYLERTGFQIGDSIVVTVEENQIIITKPVTKTVAMLPSEIVSQ